MLSKTKMRVLGRVFDAEVSSAFNAATSHLVHLRSKSAKELWAEGYLDHVGNNLYQLTNLGRFAYCSWC